MQLPPRHGSSALSLRIVFLSPTLPPARHLVQRPYLPTLILSGYSTYFSSSSPCTELICSSPFLQYVSNVRDFDDQLITYVSQGYVQSKYVNLFGCNNVDLSNTTDYYARYTTSFLCNGIIQNSRQPCGLSEEDSRPLCADSCADLALSEETIISSSQLCSGRSANYESQLRADFTNCALPANSLTGTCIEGYQNQPDNCGFADNLVGLCNYCRASTENATDSCCFTSDTPTRCQDVTLPVFSSIANVFTSTATASATSSPNSGTGSNNNIHGHGLSGGAIAGIVIGSILGFLLLLALIILGCLFWRRKRQGSTNVLNQPSPPRKGVATAGYSSAPGSSSAQGFEVLPGGRVARMAALSGDDGNKEYPIDSDPYGDSPGSEEKIAGVMGAVKTDRSPGSDSNNDSSNEYSSPDGVASGQSEQLPFFKDYYSNDDIHPGEKVAVLWAYQPRAGDEFELERGDMLKVVGIWDDGWATGVRINERAEDYEGKHKAQRDSGVSNGSGQREGSPPPAGEIKAFPLVCVCLPEAWKKTVEGDSSTEGSGVPDA